MLNRLFASRKRPFLAGLNKPQHIEMDISGSKLELDVPAHNDASLPEQQAPLSHFNFLRLTAQSSYTACAPVRSAGRRWFIKCS
ncbi:MAG: hypothetical protein VB958_03460 [Thalassolituus sp.]|uniref:hypothetical protein n=1 Tax=Thalassolituus sp. TaxID=2030822 RepID=UPI0039824597